MAHEVAQRGPWTVGLTATVSATFTRPNDANAYTAGDVVADSTSTATILKFKNVARTQGGGGVIQSAILVDSIAAATKPDLELYLFDAPPAMQADNAAWNPTDPEMLACVGVIAFPLGAFKTAGANGIIDSTGIAKAYNCAANTQDLYGILVARNAYTPTALEVFEVRLQVLQD